MDLPLGQSSSHAVGPSENIFVSTNAIENSNFPLDRALPLPTMVCAVSGHTCHPSTIRATCRELLRKMNSLQAAYVDEV